MTSCKILIVTNDMEIGGVQKLLVGFLKHYDRHFLEPTVALVCGSGPLIEEIIKLGIELKQFQCIRRNNLFKWIDPIQILKLAFWIKKEKFQIVHTHLFLGNLIGRIAAIIARVPVIYSTEHNTYLQKTFLQRKIDYFLSKFNKSIISVSDAVADFTSKQENINRRKFQTILNGIDVENFNINQNKNFKVSIRNELKLSKKTFVIGSVGRLVPQKDFHLLLKAFSIFQKNEKTIQSMLVIVGDGPEKSNLEKIAIELGIHSLVFFTGFHLNVIPYLMSFDIFITTPIYEGFGLVLLEAMSTNTPIIAAKVGGIPEVILDGETGILVHSREPIDYAKAMSIILHQDKEVTKKMTEAAKNRLNTTFTIQNMVINYQKLYQI